MQIWAESGKSALPICNYSQILYQFLTFTQNLKRSRLILSVIASIYYGYVIYLLGTNPEFYSQIVDILREAGYNY